MKAETKVQKEIWKPVKGYEGMYQVSNLGRVRSLDRLIHQKDRWGNIRPTRYKGKLKKGSLKNTGYYAINLKEKRDISIHRLVAEAFIPNPENKPCVNHINGIKTDNRVENLEWCTYRENTVHAYKNDLSKKGKKHYKTNLNEKQVRDIKYNLSHLSDREAAEKYGIVTGAVWNIRNNMNWKHI